ncbi:pyridoxamine 5'-phosphate oxidase family protein [Flavilitoribacter nigricans]|uniref:Pyridoxamine 5'-phosphate oxidase n=1 Tax=Flavilitoribacter nigricans (strain ATCC 23147 / DSM 23189 / NBRC 102662 / NCIMB 1420 / SS-2) TaxID=1122177 RepID=A0A2D0NHD7_FLAN2|nr:pyridoxamine 5'-phosphate oxidase family protein [Flavilitoribacter nigricans]PHN07914.1 pyridoxamine 5'-phosphate oxidase [Flavilitoribacter nigricans DSM 23189 = NBRC 102662]
MGKRLDHIRQDLQEFIQKQKIFFVATAADEGRVNLSPKGTDSFRILGPNRVMWLNLTGSGNETAAHLLNNNRITVMFCAFEGKPLILRLYGTARAYHEQDEAWKEYIGLFPAMTGARQLFDIEVDLVQTSCGMAVPYMDYVEERNMLNDWADKRGREGVREYWEQKNQLSLDGQPTGIFSHQAADRES